MTEQNATTPDEAAREHKLRLECLRLVNDPHFPKESVDAARLYEDYLLGTNDADIVRAARELAEKVGKSD